jgi:hypothetical protein
VTTTPFGYEGIQLGMYPEAALGLGASYEIDDHFMTDQGLRPPIHRDEGEHAVLDLRSVCEALELPSGSIASLRSLYERRQALYEHQAWARSYLGL